MKASIVIPTYRRQALLVEAMQSAANQDYPEDGFEVIVVNDGGSGTTRRNVRAAWTSDVPLSYCRIPHKGLSAAVNRGIELSRGEYFTILADDDLILPNKLDVMCGFLDAHPNADVAYSLPKYIDIGGRSRSCPPELATFLAKHPVLTWQHILDRHGLWVHGTATVYRKSVIKSVGGWDENLPTSEEFEWHLRLLHGGHDFHAVDAVTTVYRQHAGSKSAGFSKHRNRYRKQIYGQFFSGKTLEQKTRDGIA